MSGSVERSLDPLSLKMGLVCKHLVQRKMQPLRVAPFRILLNGMGKQMSDAAPRGEFEVMDHKTTIIQDRKKPRRVSRATASLRMATLLILAWSACVPAAVGMVR